MGTALRLFLPLTFLLSCEVPQADKPFEPHPPVLSGRGPGGEIALTFPEIERYCQVYAREQRFTARKEHPRNFILYGSWDTWYCVSVIRTTGYITLSHDEGDVTREGERFRWCVLGEGEENPKRLNIQSLSPEAEFWVKLERK